MKNQFEDKGFTPENTNLKDLELYRKGSVLLIAMNKFKNDREAARQAANHLDSGLIGELTKTFKELNSRTDVSSVILTSSHRMSFCRGARIENLLGASADQCRFYIEEAQKLILEVQRCNKPVIALINGLAFGGGLELVMGCDYRLASDRHTVLFGLPESSLGIIPGMGGTQNSIRLIGREKALDIMLHARVDLTPDQALKDGLVDQVISFDQLIAEGFRFASRTDLKKTFTGAAGAPTVNPQVVRDQMKQFLAQVKLDKSPDQAVAPIAKAIIHFVVDETRKDAYLDGLKYELEAVCILQQTADCQEGLKAMTEARKPVFKGI